MIESELLGKAGTLLSHDVDSDSHSVSKDQSILVTIVFLPCVQG